MSDRDSGQLVFDSTKHGVDAHALAPPGTFRTGRSQTGGFVAPTNCLALSVATESLYRQRNGRVLPARSFTIENQVVVEQVNPDVEDLGVVMAPLAAVIASCTHSQRGSRTGTTTSTMRIVDTSSLGWPGSIGYAERISDGSGPLSSLTVLLPANHSAAAVQVNERGSLPDSALTSRVKPIVTATKAGAIDRSDPDLPPRLSFGSPLGAAEPPGFVRLDGPGFHTMHRRTGVTDTWVSGNDVLRVSVAQQPSRREAQLRFSQLPPAGTPGDVFRVKFDVPAIPQSRAVELADAGEYDQIDFVAGRYLCRVVETNSTGGNKQLATRVATAAYYRLHDLTS
ncbi:MAG: hypothetical protein JO214_09890 [Frankiaceae bacterium]|nr:hypothetical protein [Frankiaceae bacterium]